MIVTSKNLSQTVRTETWSNSQTEVLETNVNPLGTVIGIHGTNAIIMTCKISDPLFRAEWKQYRRMFSEGMVNKYALAFLILFAPVRRPGAVL